VIAFATRAGLAARADVIEVLHFSGAEQGFIANLFQNRFATMGALAGLLGGAGAAIIGAGARYLGGGAGLAPVLPLAWIDLAGALPCPLVAALVAGFRPAWPPSRLVEEHAVKNLRRAADRVMVWGLGLLAFAGRVDQSTPAPNRPSPTGSSC
jgi:cell division transport system permease protein